METEKVLALLFLLMKFVLFGQTLKINRSLHNLRRSIDNADHRTVGIRFSLSPLDGANGTLEAHRQCKTAIELSVLFGVLLGIELGVFLILNFCK